jgi:hypothetical protein
VNRRAGIGLKSPDRREWRVAKLAQLLASPVLCSDALKSRASDYEEGDTTMKKSKSGAKEKRGGDSPSQLIDARIRTLGDWRGETLARVRTLIKEADPEAVEEVKWRKPSNGMLGVSRVVAQRHHLHS